jgi:hypothetical protein
LHGEPGTAARAGVDSPETQTIGRAAGCHVNFFSGGMPSSPESHAIHRLVTEAHRNHPRLYLMRDL